MSKLYEHYKTTNIYEVLFSNATNEADLKHMVVYRGSDGRVWIRPYDNFHEVFPDGIKRFRPLNDR